MSRLRLAAGASALGLLLGCGGAKPPVVTAPSRPAPPSPPVVMPLTAVPAPPELIAVARIANLAKAADLAAAWSGMPLDWRALIAKEAPGLERVAVLSEPVDFAAALDKAGGETPKVSWAVAFGVSGADAAAAFFRQAGGRVVAEGASYHVAIGSELGCEIAPSLGATPARVVCSDSGGSVGALSPYMTRGLPTESFGPADVHAHVLAEPFHRRYGAQLGLLRTMGVPFALRELEVDDPRLDRAIRDVLYGLADEIVALAYDADRVDLDLATTPASDAVDVSLALSLAGQRSWWGQSMIDAAAHGGSAPDPFWKLPADATSASYSAYSNPERLRGIAASLRGLLEGWLEHERVPEKRRVSLGDAFEQALTLGAKSAQASLPTEPRPVEGAQGRIEESVRVGVGEHLFVVDQGGDRLVRLSSELAKVIAEKGVRDQVVKSKLLEPDELPRATERAPKGIKGLPPGSKVIEIEVPAALLAKKHDPAPLRATSTQGKKPKRSKVPPMCFYLMSAPDGPLTWFAFGTDEKAIGARLVAARGGTGRVLAARDGLGSLRTEPALSAGFSSLAGIVGGMGATARGGDPIGDAKSLLRLPHRGETPLLWRVAADAHGPKVGLSGRVPRAIVEDIVALTATRIAGPLLHQ